MGIEMAGLLSGLAGLGLDDLENINIYEEEKKEPPKKVEVKKKETKIEEKNFIYEKNFTCPVCDKDFTSKIMKTGKAKLLGTDSDLRPRYEGIDAAKYDVELCPCCGYAALSRFFPSITSVQAKLVRDNISQKVHLNTYNDETYSYEEALERYKLCLANAVVKRAKASEKAYICLKSAWLVRGYMESLQDQANTDQALLLGLKDQENSYLQNAFNGFVEARQSEGYPMCGMDEMTVDYLLAVLATRFGKYDVASKLVATIITSHSASARTKDKARELKDQILMEMKKK